MKNILLTVKECESTTVVSPIVEKTADLANKCSSKVQIIHIAPPARHPPFNVDSDRFHQEIATELHHRNDHLQHLAKCMQDMNVNASAELVHGPVIRTILHESERLDADLVILGRNTHGPLYRALMDSIDKSLLAKCSCSIMFVPV